MFQGLEQIDTIGLKDPSDFPSLEEKSSTGPTTNLVNTLGVFDFQQQKFKLEDELKMVTIIVEAKNRRALQGEALFKEVEEEFEIVGFKLQKVTQEVGDLIKEEETIHFQMDGMKKGGGMCFWPTPIMHSTKPLDDGSRNFVIIKSCGYCHSWFHYDNIAIINFKHTFHPFCLGTML